MGMFDSTYNQLTCPVCKKTERVEIQFKAYVGGYSPQCETVEIGKSLENTIKNEAKDIKEKYIEPPHTTDVGVLFLGTEGLYAEVLRRPRFDLAAHTAEPAQEHVA